MQTTDNSATPEIPKLLYKFRKWGNDPEGYHKLLLAENEVYFSRPEEFNDPFDCKIPPRLDRATTGERRDAFKKKFREEYLRMSRVEQQKDLRHRTLESGNPEWQKMKMQEISLELNSGLGCYSLSARPDNLLMWSHYADSHRGICVGLSTVALERFRKQVLRNSNVGITLQPVNYVDEYPIYDAYSDTRGSREWGREVALTKARDWKYEAEYRLYFFDKKVENRAFKLPASAIEIVILGAKFPDVLKDEVFRMVEQKCPNASVVSASLGDDSFCIDIPND